MKIPTFTNESQIRTYLRGNNDPLVMQVLEEYWWNILNLQGDDAINEINFFKLNVWVRSQVETLWAGYEEYYNDTINA